jgi:hypothetical protein
MCEGSSKIVDGANGGRRRVAELLGRARKRSREGFIGPGGVPRRLLSSFMDYRS